MCKSYFFVNCSSVINNPRAPFLSLSKCHTTGGPWAPLTYFNDGGVRRIFLGLTFWPKGIFWGLWKTPRFFWVVKTTPGFFWVLYFSSAQINNNISAIYCLCGITGYFWDCNLCEKYFKLPALHVHLIQREIFNRLEFQLSLVDATYLEAYFSLDNYGDTLEYMADDGRRVQLSRTRTGRLRRAVVYTAH